MLEELLKGALPQKARTISLNIKEQMAMATANVGEESRGYFLPCLLMLVEERRNGITNPDLFQGGSKEESLIDTVISEG